MAGMSLLRKISWKPPTLSILMLIKWWMILRVILVTTTIAVVGIFSVRQNVPFSGLNPFPGAVALVTMAVSYLFYRVVKKGEPSEIHFFLQYFFDICLISLVNLITLPLNVNFVPLFVLSIAVASILSFRSGAFFAATAASVFYLPVGLRVLSLGLSFTRVFELDVLYLGNRWLWLNIGLQIFLFYAIATITSYLSLRLRSTGSELEDTRKTLRQHRLDTDVILENISSGLVTCGSERTVVYANAAAASILGLPVEKLLRKPAEPLFAGHCPEINHIIDLALKSRVLVSHRTVNFSGEKGELPLAVSSSLLLESSGTLRGVSLIFEDITNEAKARELELRSGKLEAVAELSASLAHEIKNPLSSIRSAVELLRDTQLPQPGSRTAKLMDCIIKESDRLTELLKQFLQFAADGSGPAEDFRLGELLAEVYQAVSHHPEWRVSLELEVSGEVGSMRVRAHRASLSQVFFNLLINASQVAGRDGRKASRIKIQAADRRGRRRADEGLGKSYHWLCFCDDGPGIERPFRERIFEPFFSTRKGGFGLGLAVAHRIVTALGGVIYVDEPPGGSGAAFFIALPRGEEESPDGKKVSQEKADLTAAG